MEEMYLNTQRQRAYSNVCSELQIFMMETIVKTNTGVNSVQTVDSTSFSAATFFR